MRKSYAQIACVVAAAWLLGGVSASAAKFNRVLEIGSPAPNWQALPGVDERAHGLADYASSKLVVLIFTRNNCPIAQGYVSRLIDFTRVYGPQGVAVVALNVSHLPGEDIEKMRSRAREKGFNFPYLRDSSQKTARAYGATVTPHVFVLDQQRKIAYMGAFDDHPQADKVEQAFVREAVESLLAGKPVETEETLQRGCGIDYEDDEK
jgi:peroxiredoxin